MARTAPTDVLAFAPFALLSAVGCGDLGDTVEFAGSTGADVDSAGDAPDALLGPVDYDRALPCFVVSTSTLAPGGAPSGAHDALAVAPGATSLVFPGLASHSSTSPTYNFSLPHNACADSVDSGYVAGCCENEGYGGYATPGMWT